MKRIDLNCDMGESFGPWQMGRDAEIMPFITSANIACGFHAGDPATIAETIELAMRYGVSVGAHPGFPDMQGFGRRTMSFTAGEVFDIVQYQVAAVKGMCEARGGRLRHVKPHGALYNQAAKDMDLANAVARAVASIDRSLVLYGLSGSSLLTAANEAGIAYSSEVFADRTYQPDGSLTSRTCGNALINDAELAAQQVIGMVRDGRVAAYGGNVISIAADTICIHGDAANAVEFARVIRNALENNGISIRHPIYANDK